MHIMQNIVHCSAAKMWWWKMLDLSKNMPAMNREWVRNNGAMQNCVFLQQAAVVCLIKLLLPKMDRSLSHKHKNRLFDLPLNMEMLSSCQSASCLYPIIVFAANMMKINIWLVLLQVMLPLEFQQLSSKWEQNLKQTWKIKWVGAGKSVFTN